MLSPIQAGQHIRIVQPAYRFNTDYAAKVEQRLAGYGLCLESPRKGSGFGKLSDGDECRAAEIMQAFSDHDAGAILVGHGGYGCTRILDRLDLDQISRNPKPIIGFSDATALTVALTASIGQNAIHGPNAKTLADDTNDETMRVLAAILHADWPAYNHCLELAAGQLKWVRTGQAEGKVIGGNLSILASLCGTAFAAETSGAILFLEEWNEPHYRFDRMLTQLKLAGLLDNIIGLIVGHLSEISRVGIDLGEDLESRILELVPAEIPIVTHFPAGHDFPNISLMQSGYYRLSENSIEFIPG